MCAICRYRGQNCVSFIERCALYGVSAIERTAINCVSFIERCALYGVPAIKD